MILPRTRAPSPTSAFRKPLPGPVTSLRAEDRKPGLSVLGRAVSGWR